MTRADFIVAPGNRAALAFLDSCPDWPAPAVALFGPQRVGQDPSGAHLGGARRRRRCSMRASCAQPMAGAAVVENIDSASDVAHEPALFAMLERGAPLLLTGRGAPAAWPVALPDLASRFRALLAFELGAPTRRC